MHMMTRVSYTQTGEFVQDHCSFREVHPVCEDRVELDDRRVELGRVSIIRGHGLRLGERRRDVGIAPAEDAGHETTQIRELGGQQAEAGGALGLEHAATVSADTTFVADGRVGTFSYYVPPANASLRPLTGGSEELVRSEHVATASSAQQTSACVVCLSGDSTHALVPCGHVCVCGTCLGAVVGRERRCPMCRATVDSSMRVYLCL